MRLNRSLITLAFTAITAMVVTSAGGDIVELTSTNPEYQGRFGTSVAGIPDCNGDGVDDVIVGADDENGGGVNNAGRAYIFSGATGALIRAHSSPNDSINGHYGYAVSGIPDINGDGRGDYIVGAFIEPGPGGHVYVYSGASGSLIRAHTSPNAENGGSFGFCVAGVRDLSGDGRGDYVIGAPLESNGAIAVAGRVYVYSGSSGNIIRTHTSPNAEELGRFGYSVSAIPDVNNDARGDYIVGAPFEDPGLAQTDSGKAYIYSGSSGAVLQSLSSGEPDVNGQFGYSVAGLPDVGGNGFGDVLVGAPYETLQQPGVDLVQCGFAYLFSGTSGTLAQSFGEPAANQSSEGYFGSAVGGIDDMDGDGLGEMIIGASGWPGYYAYVYNGGSPYTLKSTLTTPDTLGNDQLWGSAVAGVGDVTGDGRGDYIIGGPGSDDFPSGLSQAGRAYLYRPVYNDGCSLFADVPLLIDGFNDVTTIGANQGNSEDDCPAFADPGPDVWYRYVASCTGTAQFSTCNLATWNTKIAAYEGCSYDRFFMTCKLDDLIGCNDNGQFCTAGTSALTINVIEGACYFIRLGGANDESGAGTLKITPTCMSCIGDINNDGNVDGADLSTLLGSWGGTGVADLNDDNIVNGADLSIMLGAWGPC